MSSAGRRDRVFLVSKVWPSHVAADGIARACAASLARLDTDYLDLYLVHWPTGVTDFASLVRAFENLRSAGKIRAWGVSNFNVSHMEALLRIPQGDRCATNQVSYNVGDRSIERDLLPWCERHAMPVIRTKARRITYCGQSKGKLWKPFFTKETPLGAHPPGGFSFFK